MTLVQLFSELLFTRTRSITKQEVRGTNFLSFRNKYILDPIYCPITKAGTVKRRVVNSKPVPAANRNKMIKATGICIARRNCKENLRTFALQYPNGILIIKVNNVNKRIFIPKNKTRSARLQSCCGARYKISNM